MGASFYSSLYLSFKRGDVIPRGVGRRAAKSTKRLERAERALGPKNPWELPIETPKPMQPLPKLENPLPIKLRSKYASWKPGCRAEAKWAANEWKPRRPPKVSKKKEEPKGRGSSWQPGFARRG